MTAHPCGCTSPRERLDHRHVVHYSNATPDDPIDEVASRAAWDLLCHARSLHRTGIVNRNANTLEEARKAYKVAALKYAGAADVSGAVIADSMDEELDFDIEAAISWDEKSYNETYNLG